MIAGMKGGGLARWAKSSLQRQFSLIAAGLIVIASGAFLLLVVQQYRSAILDAHEQASMNVNLLLQSVLENAMINRDLVGLQTIVSQLGAQEDVAGVMITDPSGEIRFSSYAHNLNQILSDPDFSLAVATGTRQSSFRALNDGQEVLRSINPVANQPRCTGCHGAVAQNVINGLLIVDYEAAGTRETVRRGTWMLAGFGFVVLLLLEAGLWIALRALVLTRIQKLAGSTQAIAEGDLSIRTAQNGSDELAQLSASFDEMADQLERNLGEIRSSFASLQTLIDAIPDGVRVIGPDFRVIMANKAYSNQIGADLDTVIGYPCYASSHKRSEPCVPTLVRCPVVSILQQDHNDLTSSHVHVDSEGSEFSVEVSAAAVTLILDGHPQRCVVESIRDMESDISISQKQRLAELGGLAAGIAHEVYNPLSSISLALKAIASQSELSEEMEQYVEIAETEIGNCMAINDSLLRLSALPQAQSELVELADVIRDTGSLLNFESKQFDVAIEQVVEGHPRVLARDSDIRNLVFNLVLNAIHAMPGGGKVQIFCRAEGGQVVIEVKDTGVGIPEREQRKIFLPFWTRRADGSQGRGLGLAICSATVKKLGGHLSFTSHVGVGTCFRVALTNADEESE